MSGKTKIAKACALMMLTAGVTAEEGATNIIENGSFNKVKNGQIVGWENKRGQSVGGEAGNHWLVLEGKRTTHQKKVALDPSRKTLNVSFKVKLTDVVKGEKSYHNARVPMKFVKADGKMAGKWPRVFGGEGTTEWTEFSRSYTIPEGTTTLLIGPSMLGESGKIELDDLCVTAE